MRRFSGRARERSVKETAPRATVNARIHSAGSAASRPGTRNARNSTSSYHSTLVALAKLRAAVDAVVTPPEVEGIVEAAAWTLGLASPGGRSSESTPGDIQARIYAAWTRYLAGLGRDRPTVLAIEDIHWASEPLLDLLDHLADALDDTSVLIVCPARPELLETRPGWGAGKKNAVALNLSSLSPSDSRRLVNELLDADRVFEDARERIVASAEGNPFYLEEILRMLIEQGAIEREDDGWIATARLREVPIPDSVHGVIAARVDLLEAPARDALRRSSVMGRTFWPAAVDIRDEQVEVLVRRGLVTERPSSVVAGMREFTFKHALTRDVAYQTLPRPERRALHRTVGDWIYEGGIGRGDEMAEFAAYHYVEALEYGDGDPALARRAFELLLGAGESAIAREAVPSAVGLFERAGTIAADERDRCLVLVALARCDIAAFANDRATTKLLEATGLAREAGDPLLVSDVLGLLTRISWLSGQWDEALRYAAQALEALEGQPESRALASALARRSQLEMLRGEPIAEEHALEAIEVATRVGDEFAAINGRINLFTARGARGMRPAREDVVAIFATALDAGYLDEAYRVAVNYIWSASPFETIPDLRQQLDELTAQLADVHAVEFSMYHQYLALSRAKFLWIPSGEWERVEVELGTLDERGCLGGMPFQPEMVKYCGQRGRVFRSVDKIFDYGGTRVMRRLEGCVLLAGLRCGGEDHGQCQARCYLMWRTEWLRRPGEAARPAGSARALSQTARGPASPHGTETLPDGTTRPRYHCQFTQLQSASRPMGAWEIGKELRPLVAGNITLATWLVGLGTRLFNLVQKARGGTGYPGMPPRRPAVVPIEPQPLAPGDAVVVRPGLEIASTLNEKNKHRGLWFDRDQLKYCGTTHKVLARVERIIDDVHGQMLPMKTPCILLEGVDYSGESLNFSAQHDLFFWREVWLKKQA